MTNNPDDHDARIVDALEGRDRAGDEQASRIVEALTGEPDAGREKRDGWIVDLLESRAGADGVARWEAEDAVETARKDLAEALARQGSPTAFESAAAEAGRVVEAIARQTTGTPIERLNQTAAATRVRIAEVAKPKTTAKTTMIREARNR